MNPGRFFIPRMGAVASPMMGVNFLPTRGSAGLFTKIFGSLKSFNWSGLLNGANKTLNVVNQTIPLVRQAGPMLNNMKSMMRLAKVFGSETTSRYNLQSRNNNISNNNINTSNTTVNTVSSPNVDIIAAKKEVSDNNYPNFFV